jgi:lipoic acid synthetase
MTRLVSLNDLILDGETPDRLKIPRKPAWLKVRIPGGANYHHVRSIIDEHRLHTVCESAHCPNMGECWDRGTATFMILGDVCTRSCGFCNVLTGRPESVDENEPERVAEAASKMALRHVVITSVDRDDLPDGGASIWVRTVEAVRMARPEATVEILIPDFQGETELIDRVLASRPDILNHNIETVPRLYRAVRPQAKYEWSMGLLRRSADSGLLTKSGMMVGLGERREELESILRDWRSVGVNIVTIGQYLQPSRNHLPVHRFVSPEEFDDYRAMGLELGFDAVESGPLVRSSYHADEHARLVDGAPSSG